MKKNKNAINQKKKKKKEEENYDGDVLPELTYDQPKYVISPRANLASGPQNIGYTRFRSERIEEVNSGPFSSKIGLKRSKEETVEVERGRIVRSTATKDRHSKVSTAKGPRDRRVRLSADTAIQFYDVQDRLGCDRPSKAIDWLMKAAKAAIDALDDLPPKNNLSATTIAYQPQHKDSKISFPPYEIQNQHRMYDNPTNSLSFFSTQTSSSDFKIQTQDLCLSLQSFQEDPILQHPLSPIDSLFSASCPLVFNPTSEIQSHNQLFSQRELLQSSFPPLIQMPIFSYNLSPVIGDISTDRLSGFSVLPRVQGQEDQQILFCNKSSSVLHYQD